MTTVSNSTQGVAEQGVAEAAEHSDAAGSPKGFFGRLRDRFVSHPRGPEISLPQGRHSEQHLYDKLSRFQPQVENPIKPQVENPYEEIQEDPVYEEMQPQPPIYENLPNRSEND